jgi:hypothetical protein
MVAAFPTNIKPVVNQGYSHNMPNNVVEQPVSGGASLLMLDTSTGYVDFQVAIVGSLTKQQAFNDFYVNDINKGTSKFTMNLDSGNGLEVHTCQIVPNSVRQDASGDPTRIITMTVRAEKTPFQDNPYGGGFAELYEIYGEGLEQIIDDLGIFVLIDAPAAFPPA